MGFGFGFVLEERTLAGVLEKYVSLMVEREKGVVGEGTIRSHTMDSLNEGIEEGEEDEEG